MKIPSRLGTTKDLFGGRLAVSEAELSAVVYREDGNVEDLGVICRKKVLGVFVTDIVNCLSKTSPYNVSAAVFQDYKYHRAGIATTAEANTQAYATFDFTDCPTYVSGTQVAGGTATAPTYTSVGTISFTSSLAITEHGLFNANSGTPTCMDRSVFTAINVVSGDSIQFTYVMTINAEA